MKNLLKKLQIIIIFMLIWIILNENITLFTLISGVIISIFTLQITNMLLKIDYAKAFYVPASSIIILFFLMLKEIYRSAFVMTKCIFTGEIVPTFIEYKSELKDPLSLFILSNSITLPPGSVTVSRDEQNLTILSINPNQEAVRREIYEIIEKRVKPLEGRN